MRCLVDLYTWVKNYFNLLSTYHGTNPWYKCIKQNTLWKLINVLQLFFRIIAVLCLLLYYLFNQTWYTTYSQGPCLIAAVGLAIGLPLPSFSQSLFPPLPFCWFCSRFQWRVPNTAECKVYMKSTRKTRRVNLTRTHRLCFLL